MLFKMHYFNILLFNHVIKDLNTEFLRQKIFPDDFLKSYIFSIYNLSTHT